MEEIEDKPSEDGNMDSHANGEKEGERKRERGEGEGSGGGGIEGEEGSREDFFADWART